MRLRERFLNSQEQLVFRELTSIAADNQLLAFAKPRLSDVLEKDRFLTPSEFSMFTRSHFDFLLTDKKHIPILAIEYDGPRHDESTQVIRDKIKNQFCLESALPLVRIGANYVTRMYRGMTLLRWIVEVIELEKAFEEARADGHVPWDELFDPAMIHGDGSGREWPYWLSIHETHRVNKFIKGGIDHRSWGGLFGTNEDGNILWLEYVQTENGFLCTRCRFRNQQAPFEFWDMMREVSRFEIGRKVLGYANGEASMHTETEFFEIIRNLHVAYKLRPSHSSGKLGVMCVPQDIASAFRFSSE